MLMKICQNCRQKIPQGKRCECKPARHKLYNEKRRDKERNDFYHSREWRKLVEMVKARANGLDEYALSQGRLEQGNTVHHILPIEERPDLIASFDNLIYLSAKNHSRIHREYEKDSAAKAQLQSKLAAIVAGEGEKVFD